MMVFNIEPINEVYFGKTPELLAIEKQLDKFRNKYMGSYVLNTGVNSDPELLKFDRMMEDFFGLGCFTLKIINEPIVNGFTMPISYRVDTFMNKKSNVSIVDKKGYKFNKELQYSMIICAYSGVIFNDNFTTEEVMALIMHEVGHNFAASINDKHGCMVDIFMITGTIIDLCTNNFLDLIMSTNSYRITVDIIEKQLRKNNSIFVKLYDFIKDVKSLINTGIYGITELINVISLGTMYALSNVLATFNNLVRNPLSMVFLPMSYSDEKIADNFPTIYGYGNATITLQEKLNSEGAESASFIMKRVNKIPFLSTLIHTVELPSFILLTALDPHPAGIVRAKDQLELLKKEIKKEDLDPKMKKCILADIKTCEESLKGLTDTTKGFKDPYLAKRAYYKLLASTNGELKDWLLDDKNRHSGFDTTFDRIRNR